MDQIPEEVVAGDLERRGREAARLIWQDGPAAGSVADPRHPAFASGLLSGLGDAMRAAPGIVRRVVGHAAAAAEDLNVESFQGLIEVLQNADDLGASDVRFALVEEGEGRRLLIVHDGAPVTCHHVLPMTLPYLTSKTDDAEQKGRFGIGLKTLRRIASSVAIHSAPYHFAAESMIVHEVGPSPHIPGFYDPLADTLFELELTDEFDASELENWFLRFDEENLLFLKSVARFAWIDLASGEERVHSLTSDPWTPLGSDVPEADCRTARGSRGSWTVFRFRVPRPKGIDRSLKATGETVSISVALSQHGYRAGLFIGFRTRIPVVLPFSVDAQFDPSTARESLIENGWNRWLIARVGEVVGSLVRHTLANDPVRGWSLLPVDGERVGLPEEAWPHDSFAAAFSSATEHLATDAAIHLGDRTVALSKLCYEADPLEGLLQEGDLARLRPDAVPLPTSARDPLGRWRSILRNLSPAGEVGPAELADGFRRTLFADRPTRWWVEAACRLTRSAPEVVPETPCWLSDAGDPVAVHAKGTTERPLVIGEPLSDFAKHWKLFERLEEAYRDDPAGERALAWLRSNAAVKSEVDVDDELAAFAEAYRGSPVIVTDTQLRELRDRFDLLTDRKAEPLGPRVGAALRLDGFVWRAGRKFETKVAPTEAYLSRTLDSDYAFWPEAAGELPDIPWLAPSYNDRLRTGATRSSRKRSDGTISRGPRKFLMLLGAACSPRVIPTGRKAGGNAHRVRELQRVGAEYVNADFVSPHLERVLAGLSRSSKRDRRIRSAALLKALSRYWETYEPSMSTTAFHRAIKHEYAKGQIDTDWLCRLREAEWVAVGNGDLVRPDRAVVRSPQTQTLYEPRTFVTGIGPDDLRGGFAAALHLVTDVRASDLVAMLEEGRSGATTLDEERVLQAYRALAKMCRTDVNWNSKVGDLTVQDLRRRFAGGGGLIRVAADRWRRPDELFTGRDIFREPERFVPGGQSCAPLWSTLTIGKPGVADCIRHLRLLGGRPYTVDAEGILIDVYRHLEPLLQKADRRDRVALRTLPVGTAGGWCKERPVFHVSNRELRERLQESRPDLRFWVPPCDVHALPNVTNALGLNVVEPTLSMAPDLEARIRGDAHASRFRECVDHLANELARNDPSSRDRIGLRWESLRKIPLAVHSSPFDVHVSHESLSPKPIRVRMDAVLQVEPALLTVTEEAFSRRDRCGRAIASLFPADTRHRIEAEWVASWTASTEAPVERMRMASDQEHERAMAEHAAAATASAGRRINVTPPASRSTKVAPPRRLKAAHGPVVSVTVVKGQPPGPARASRPLASGAPPPPPPPPASTNLAGPVEYDRRDLEQRGWEILSEVLNANDATEIVDFRNRHRIGADGVIDWKTFVELKATGGGPQSAVELSAAEYERARERGLDFILALVSGLEEGQKTEIRLVIDPLNRVGVRPMGSMRLVGLGSAPAVVLRLED